MSETYKKVKQIIWANDCLYCLTDDGRIWRRYETDVDWKEVGRPSEED